MEGSLLSVETSASPPGEPQDGNIACWLWNVKPHSPVGRECRGSRIDSGR